MRSMVSAIGRDALCADQKSLRVVGTDNQSLSRIAGIAGVELRPLDSNPLGKTARMTEDEIIASALTILETRLKLPERYFQSPQEVKSYLQLQFDGAKSESFRVLYLNSQHGLISNEEMFRGTIDSAAVYPREIVRAALDFNAAAVILAHNHPSGFCEPSQADRNLTERLISALKLIDVRVLDHIVVGGIETVSFAERCWI